jgi:hypothetical protein
VSTRALLIATAALLALAGCSSSKAAEPPKQAAPATTAAPTDPYDVYTAHVTAAGLTPEIQRNEAVSVAGNTCDNTVTDMVGLVTMSHTLYPTDAAFRDSVIDRADFIDAYCPNERVVFDAATQQVIGEVIPAAH